MTRKQLYKAVCEALDNGEANGNPACRVSNHIVARELGSCCSTVEGISERRLIPAVAAWKLSKGCKAEKRTPQDQGHIDLIYQGADL